MKFNWYIDAVNHRESTGLVLEASWRVVGEDGGDETAGYGSVILQGGSPDEPGFIPYEDLTESIVLGWVKTYLGDEKISEIEAGIEARYLNKKDPVVSGAPWAQEEIIESPLLEDS
jgi:hypothetical protein